MVIDPSTIRGYAARAGRVISSAQARPSLAGRFVAHLIVLFLLVLGLLLFIPVLLLFIATGLLLWGYARLRRLAMHVRSPNGLLDGRRNVRVVTDPNRRSRVPDEP